METSSRRWDSRGRKRAFGQRMTTQKYRATKTTLGPREKRRLGQLSVCVILFLIVFLGKGIFPQKIVTLREQLLHTLRADTDFKSVFSRLGESISEGDPVTDTLGVFWVEAFGVGDVTLGGEVETATGTFQTQTTFLSGFPQEEDLSEHWVKQGILWEEPRLESEEAPKETPVPTPEPEQTPIPTMEHVAYTGPELPEKTTMDKYYLEAIGLTETTTPALGWVSSPFGWREHPVDGEEKFHNGVDLAVNEGTALKAFADGTVDYIGDSPVYGLYLQISHTGGVKTFYAHCSELLVQQGQAVTVGETVALSGSTGNATGPHLHFEIKLNGVRLNPLYYIETE